MIQQPDSPRAWERYYDIRWRLLRAPWHRPKGSERDEFEEQAFHVMWCPRPGVPIGVGRLHMAGPGEAQIRYMAVLECWQGSGIGRDIVRALEDEALRRGAGRVVLNSRMHIKAFYEALGYTVEGPGPLLFGEIPHVRMARMLNAVGSSPAERTPLPAEARAI